ncbi:MAG: hypothetical protein WKG03_14825, partial [Telluria sp.]
MNIFSSKRADSVAFQLSPVAAGCAVFLSVLATSAYAQETAPVVVAPTTTTAVDKKADEPVVQSVVVS